MAQHNKMNEFGLKSTTRRMNAYGKSVLSFALPAAQAVPPIGYTLSGNMHLLILLVYHRTMASQCNRII